MALLVPSGSQACATAPSTAPRRALHLDTVGCSKTCHQYPTYNARPSPALHAAQTAVLCRVPHNMTNIMHPRATATCSHNPHPLPCTCTVLCVIINLFLINPLTQCKMCHATVSPNPAIMPLPCGNGSCSGCWKAADSAYMMAQVYMHPPAPVPRCVSLSDSAAMHRAGSPGRMALTSSMRASGTTAHSWPSTTCGSRVQCSTYVCAWA